MIPIMRVSALLFAVVLQEREGRLVWRTYLEPVGSMMVAHADLMDAITDWGAASFNALSQDKREVDMVILKWADKGTITFTRKGVKIEKILYVDVDHLKEINRIMDLGQRFYNLKLKPPPKEGPDPIAPILREIVPIIGGEYPKIWYVKKR